MQVEAKKYLHDIHQASQKATEFTVGKSFEDYEQDAMLRAAVDASSRSSERRLHS
jgi:uncharacterized protein with HEPN domain